MDRGSATPPAGDTGHSLSSKGSAHCSAWRGRRVALKGGHATWRLYTLTYTLSCIQTKMTTHRPMATQGGKKANGHIYSDQDTVVSQPERQVNIVSIF